MELNSNAERQARYRRKEQLRRRADTLVRKWQLEPWNHHSRSIQDVQRLVDKAIELPSGWGDKEYLIAEARLQHVEAELFLAVNQIQNDIHDSSNFSSEFMTTPDPSKLRTDFEKAVMRTTELASHIISALKLSSCSEAEQAAALMEAVRSVGRLLVMNDQIPYSEATAICLATIGPQYVRPRWFTEKLADTLSKQLDQKISKEVGKQLSKL